MLPNFFLRIFFGSSKLNSYFKWILILNFKSLKAFKNNAFVIFFKTLFFTNVEIFFGEISKLAIRFILNSLMKVKFRGKKVLRNTNSLKFKSDIFFKYLQILKIWFSMSLPLPKICFNTFFCIENFSKIYLVNSYKKKRMDLKINSITGNFLNKHLLISSWKKINYLEAQKHFHDFYFSKKNLPLKNSLVKKNNRKLKLNILSDFYQNKFSTKSFFYFILGKSNYAFKFKIGLNISESPLNRCISKESFPILFQNNQNFFFVKNRNLVDGKIEKKTILFQNKRPLKKLLFHSLLLKIIKVLNPRLLDFFLVGRSSFSNYLDIIFNFFSFSRFVWSKKIFYIDFYFTLIQIIQSKKSKNLIIFLRTMNFCIWNQNFFFGGNLLVYRFFLFEMKTTKYGKYFFVWNSKNFKFFLNELDNSFKRFFYLWMIRNYTVEFNLSFKSKIQGLSASLIFPKNKFFLLHFFIHLGVIESHKVVKECFGIIDPKKKLRSMGTILKIYFIRGLIGNNFILLFYSSLNWNRFKVHDKKQFWGYWTFKEITNVDKNLRSFMFRIRLKLFILNRLNLFKQPFFQTLI